MARNEQAKATIYLDGKQAEAALDGLANRAKALRTELKKAQEAGDTIKTKKLQSEIKGVESAQRSLRKETFDYERVLRDINGASMSDLKKSLRTVEVQLNKMKRTDAGYLQKKEEAKQFRAEINKINTELRGQPSIASRAAAGFNKYFGILTAGIAAFTGILFSAKEFVKGMVGLDDSLANVMKTTGMARNEVREMYTDFRTFNTRTPRKELLELAEEAGRLGKRSRRDVMDFVEVANQIKVALGDDLGGEAGVAIREVGKLTEIYKISAQYGTDFKESMLKVGSAINEVSANSNAQAPYLIDYLKRLGGIAGQMKISAADTIGYASSLDQLGQSQEMAATAQGKLMVDMFKDQAKYAAIAKMSTEDFSNLLKTDANEAFLKLLEGLNGNNEGFSVMAEKLDGMGVDGARAVQVLSVLSANTKMVREQQALANDAMDKGISLTNEYNIKNNNLAGSVEKIGQFLRSKFINSSFLGWMEKVVAKVSEWTEVKLEDTLRKESAELNSLVTSIIAANDNQRVRNSLVTELQSKYPDFLGNIDAEKVSNEQLKKMLIEVNAQYKERIKLAALQEKTTEIQAKGIKLAAREQQIIEDVNNLYQQFRYDGLGFADTFEEQVAAFAKAGESHGFVAKGVLAGVKNLGSEFSNVQDEIKANVAEYEKWANLANNVQDKLNASGNSTTSATNANDSSTSNPGQPTTPFAPNNPAPSLPANPLAELLNADAEKQSDAVRAYFAKQGEGAFEAFIAAIEKEAAMSDFSMADKFTTPEQEEKDPALDYALAQYQETVDGKLALNEAMWQAGKIGEQEYQDNLTRITREAEENRLKIKQQNAERVADIAYMAGNLVTTLMDMELEKAGDNEEKKKEIRKKYADLNFAVSAAQIIASTAVAIMQGYAQLGPIGGAVAAVLLGATGLLQLGVANAQRKNVKSMADGGDVGYTGHGNKYDKKQLVQLHAEEYVIPQEGTQNPQLRPFIDIMEIARRNGSLARLDLRQIVQAIPAKGYSGGGFGSTPGPVSPPSSPKEGAGGGSYADPIILKKFDELKDVISKLKIYTAIEDIKTGEKNYTNIQNTRGL
jgi:TP901 family phage tail tape measure protein